MAQIIAANRLLDRGWGRQPVSVEVYEADARQQEPEESALEVLESRLAELGRRLRKEESFQDLTEAPKRAFLRVRFESSRRIAKLS